LNFVEKAGFRPIFPRACSKTPCASAHSRLVLEQAQLAMPKWLTKVGKCGIPCRRYRQGKANGSLLIAACGDVTCLSSSSAYNAAISSGERAVDRTIVSTGIPRDFKVRATSFVLFALPGWRLACESIRLAGL
jgi:hypothetical protein